MSVEPRIIWVSVQTASCLQRLNPPRLAIQPRPGLIFLLRICYYYYHYTHVYVQSCGLAKRHPVDLYTNKTDNVILVRQPVEPPGGKMAKYLVNSLASHQRMEEWMKGWVDASCVVCMRIYPACPITMKMLMLTLLS